MKKFLLKIMLAGAAAILTVPVICANVYKSMTINLTDGTEVSLPLTPAATGQYTTEGNLVLTSDNTYTVAVDKIASLSFSNQLPTSVDDIATDTYTSIEGNTIRFSGLKDGSEITVYTIDGRQVTSLIAKNEAILSLDGHTPGLYLVKVNTTTLRILVK